MKRSSVLLLSTLLVVSACSSGETESTTDTIATLETTTPANGAETTTTTDPATLEEVALDFTQCMRDRGVDMPDITFDADGQPVISNALADEFDLFDTEVQAALAGCRDIFSDAGAGTELQLDPELAADLTDQLTEWAACMRDNGVEGWPDPLPTFSGSEIPFPMAEMATAFNDPEFAGAMEACEDLVAFPGIGG